MGASAIGASVDSKFSQDFKIPADSKIVVESKISKAMNTDMDVDFSFVGALAPEQRGCASTTTGDFIGSGTFNVGMAYYS